MRPGRRASLPLCALAAALMCAGPAVAEEMYAVVIGHNGGNASLPSLSFADDDAVRFAHVFQGLGARRVWLLAAPDEATRDQLARTGRSFPLAGPPTRRAVRAAFADAARAIAARRGQGGPPVLHVVYAGHGLEGRVLLEPEASAEAALTGEELRAALAEVADADARTRLFVFLDACRSESLFAARGDTGIDLGEAVRALERRTRAVQVGILTAARTGRPAGEVRTLGAGFFSHVLASGLLGAADADGDERITFGELAAFVAFHTQKLTGQRPWFAPPGGDMRAGAVDHRGRTPRLVLEGASAAHVVVSGGGGIPIVAEAFKAPARPLRLVLPAGRYEVVRHAGADTQRTSVDLRADTATDLERVSWQGAGAAVRGAPDGPQLAFSAPFSPDVVATLEAGYDAGRAPAAGDGASSHRLALGVELSPAPLSLGGAATGLSVGYRHSPGLLVVGVRAWGSTSHHAAAELDFRRFGALAEVGVTAHRSRRFGATAALAGGLATSLSSGRTGRSGDAAGPLVSVGLDVSWRAGAGWGLYAEGRYAAHFIRVDGARRRTSVPIAALGVEAWF